MNINKEYYNLAEAIAWRSKERLCPEIDKITQETDKFFFWIMNQVLRKIEGCYPAKEHNRIELSAEAFTSDRVCVENGRLDTYCSSKELTQKEFFDVMEKVSNILKLLPNYSTKYTHKDSSKAELIVFIDVKAS